MKILLNFFFDVFFGDNSSDTSTTSCEEYEPGSAVYIMDDEGKLELKPSGTVGTRIE